jgi:transposase-like protein
VKPRLKGKQHFDEKYIPLRGKKDHYDLNCIDSKTKYITAHLTVEKRTLKKCVEFLSQIKKTCYEQILEVYEHEKHKKTKERKLITFVSDKFWNYKTAWSKLFSRVTKLVFGVPIACHKYGLEHNNNAIERENGNIKERIKTMRGGFENFKGAEAFLNLRQILHNFVNPHQSIKGRTPAEEAEMDLKLGRNKLRRLMQKRAQKKHHSLR